MKNTYICDWGDEVSIETERCASWEGPYTNEEARDILIQRGYHETETGYFRK